MAENATSIAKRKAFDSLEAAGCERETLEGLFQLLVTTKPLRLKLGLAIHLSPLDSPNELLFPMSKDELRRVKRRAEKLLQGIERLRRARLVRYLDDLPLAGYLCDAETALRRLADCLANLPKRLKGFGPKQRPDYTRRLTKIYRHIYERTGQWHDAEVAEILNDLKQAHPEKPVTDFAMKEWRKRHGLKH